MPRSFCISSRVRPFVSGIARQIKISCRNIIIVKKTKEYSPPCLLPSTMPGKTVVMIQAMIQCVELPSDPPCERTALGKISEMKTQITAPWEKAKKAMKPIR